MRRHTRKQRARALLTKERAREQRRRQQCRRAERGRLQRVARRAQRTEELVEQQLGVVGQRREHASISRGVLSQARGGCVDRPLEDDGVSVIQRMGQRRSRVDELDAVRGGGEAAEEARRRAEGQHGGADVVSKAWEGQLSRAARAADLVSGLDDMHRKTLLGQGDRRRKPVRAGTNDDGVVAGHGRS